MLLRTAQAGWLSVAPPALSQVVDQIPLTRLLCQMPLSVPRRTTSRLSGPDGQIDGVDIALPPRRSQRLQEAPSWVHQIPPSVPSTTLTKPCCAVTLTVN